MLLCVYSDRDHWRYGTHIRSNKRLGAGEQPVANPESAVFTVFHKCCDTSLKNVCWEKIKLECGYDVNGKTLTMHATGDQFEEYNCATVKKTKGTQSSSPTENFVPIPSHRLMDSTVKLKVLTKLYREVGNSWRHIGRYLNLEDGDLDNISRNHVGDQAEMSYQMFSEWKQKNGRNATYRKLGYALAEASRTDLADKLKALQGAT